MQSFLEAFRSVSVLKKMPKEREVPWGYAPQDSLKVTLKRVCGVDLCGPRRHRWTSTDTLLLLCGPPPA